MIYNATEKYKCKVVLFEINRMYIAAYKQIDTLTYGVDFKAYTIESDEALLNYTLCLMDRKLHILSSKVTLENVLNSFTVSSIP